VVSVAHQLLGVESPLSFSRSLDLDAPFTVLELFGLRDRGRGPNVQLKGTDVPFEPIRQLSGGTVGGPMLRVRHVGEVVCKGKSHRFSRVSEGTRARAECV
jgi:hypothetical protein